MYSRSDMVILFIDNVYLILFELYKFYTENVHGAIDRIHDDVHCRIMD